MEGKTHRFCAFVGVVFVMLVLSASNSDNYKPLAVGIALIAVSSLFHSIASNIKNGIELERKKEGKSFEAPRVREWAMKKSDGASWASLFLATAVSIAFADFLPDVSRSVSIGVSIMSIPTAVFAGSFMPDWDWDFGAESHRNPALHSYIAPLAIWGVCILVMPEPARYFVIMAGLFCIAYASHLFADCVNSNTIGLVNIIKDMFNTKKKAGDIRIIPEEWEHHWLFISGSVLVACFSISMMRVYHSFGWAWDTVDNNGNLLMTKSTVALVAFITALAVVWLLAFGIALKRYYDAKHGKTPNKQKDKAKK